MKDTLLSLASESVVFVEKDPMEVPKKMKGGETTKAPVEGQAQKVCRE
jgi:hypothetical protein